MIAFNTTEERQAALSAAESADHVWADRHGHRLSNLPCRASIHHPPGVRTYPSAMAQQVFVSITDDLDGSEADETITFGLDGTSYEIDLNEKNAAALRKALDKYVASARRSSGRGAGRTRASGRRPARTGDADPKAVRVWAQEHGLEVSSRGRIPAEILDRYRAAGGA